MNPWNPSQHYGQQWQQPSIVPPQWPQASAPPQRHLPPAPQRPQPTQQPSIAHSQRIVYSAPPPPPIHPSAAPSHPPPPAMAAEAPHIPRDLTPFRDLAAVVSSMLREQEARISARLDAIEIAMQEREARASAKVTGVEIAIGALSKSTSKGIAEVLEMVKARNSPNVPGPSQKEIKDAFTGLHHFITQATKAVLSKTEQLQGMLGDPNAPDYDDSKKTVFGRIDRLEQAFLELSETVSDPEAARPAIVRHEAAVNTSPPPRTTADVGIEALVPPSPLQLPQRLLQVSEVGVQAEGPVLVDAEVETRTEVPRRYSTESDTAFAPSPTTARAAPFFPKSFEVQPLAPAQWTPREEDTESSISGVSCGLPQDPPDHSQRTELYRPQLSISAVERFASSIFDEQEIDHNLGDGTDEATQCGLSTPASPHRTLPQSPLVTSCIPLPFRHTVSPPLAPSVPTIASPALPAISTPLLIPTAPSTPPSLRPLNTSSGTSHQSPTSPGVLVSGALSPSAASSSSLSSVPLSSPPLPPQQAVQLQQAPAPLERTISYSSMSSLSTVSTSDSQLSPIPAESASAAAAPVKVKTERTENGTVGRPAKRRKTVASASAIQCKTENARAGPSASSRHGRGGSSARGGRGRGRGRGGGQGGKRKSQQLLIMPIAKPAAAPVPQEPRQRYEAPRIGTDCPWPGKISGHDHREFVACDHCQGWYHFGCVGLTKGDPRLEPEAEFVCPPCESSSEIREQRRSVRFQEAACLRPDCDHPGAAEDTNEYFVERIIGRRPYRAEIDVDVTQPTNFMWLVKWDGWKADQATWAANEHLGECSRIIEEFEQAAEIEGRDLADYDAAVLLNEAAAVGWGGVRF
ncbi:hypothetical protein C8T65DRAFT_735657 [Cerioporus squamosus]|nr:hypothetical protein C8T65DRAFT_735657 [Cerioporus squamosus]